MNKSFSKRVGELFAHIQDLMDTATHTMIHRAREKGEPKNKLLGFFLLLEMLTIKNIQTSKKERNPTRILNKARQNFYI